MTEEIYLYLPRYSPGYVYRDFDRALEHLLKDLGFATLEELRQSLVDDRWWHFLDVENKTIQIDDGAQIYPMELR